MVQANSHRKATVKSEYSLTQKAKQGSYTHKKVPTKAVTLRSGDSATRKKTGSSSFLN